MNDEIFRELPNIEHLLLQKFSNKSAVPKAASIDPYKLMVQRNRINKGEIEAPVEPAPQWPEEDVKALEDYCRKMGIVGFVTRQNPKIALLQLKQQLGDFSGVSLENRIPMGYEKPGPVSKKVLLKG